MPVRRAVWIVAAVVVALALVAGVVVWRTVAAPAAVVAPAPGGFTPKAVVWGPCAHQDDDAMRCGRLAVPLDWAHPSGPTITLALTDGSTPPCRTRACYC